MRAKELRLRKWATDDNCSDLMTKYIEDAVRIHKLCDYMGLRFASTDWHRQRGQVSGIQDATTSNTFKLRERHHHLRRVTWTR